jgi:endonuclease III
VLGAAGRPDFAWLRDAYSLLRELGKAACRRGEPLCAACPLEADCPRVAVTAL